MMLEPKQIEILREIERRTGATVSEQVRRAIDAYLRTQNVITEKEIRQILKR